MAIHRSSVKIYFFGFLLCAGFFAGLNPSNVACAFANEKNYHHLVILGDPHLPGKNIPEKENVIRNINSWEDVEAVVVLGDISFDLGTAEELKYAKKFFRRLQKPLWAVAGNHDYIYEDVFDDLGRRRRASPAIRRQKLRRFQEAFNLPNVYYSKKLGRYLLVFLSTDELGPSELARISAGQMDWLRSELARHQHLPTIIFFHAPLKGTLENHKKNANAPNFTAQPEEKIRELILKNTQIFLWASGHTHTPATNESYASPINLYEKRVTNIHNCDMNRETIWTNSLFLHPDQVMIKTFNHKKGIWMESLERTVTPPKTSGGRGRANP